MPYKEKPTTKLYHSISEVAEHFEVNNSLIRFWEREFDIIKPKRNKKGNRMFTQKDMENFHVIFDLVKTRGYTLQGAKEKLRKNKDDVVNTAEIRRRLESVKEKLLAIKAGL